MAFRYDQDSDPRVPSPCTEHYENEKDADSRWHIDDILDAPLTEEELGRIGRDAIRHYEAGTQLRKELVAEQRRLESASNSHSPKSTLSPFLKYRVGKERFHILARDTVRRRWKALGIWNDDWQSPSYTADTKEPASQASRGEKSRRCSWEWERIISAHNKSHPAWRAQLHRAGLYRGESPHIKPQSHPTTESSDSDRKSFIASRPWFQFKLSTMEESARQQRLSEAQRVRANQPSKMKHIVRPQWGSQGLWKREWSSTQVGWRWPHESPSPEPEDYSRFEDGVESQLSPADLEEYESIVPATPKTPPPQSWVDRVLPLSNTPSEAKAQTARGCLARPKRQCVVAATPEMQAPAPEWEEAPATPEMQARAPAPESEAPSRRSARIATRQTTNAGRGEVAAAAARQPAKSSRSRAPATKKQTPKKIAKPAPKKKQKRA